MGMKTKKEIILFVKGEQSYEGVEPEVMELINEVTMSIDDGCEIVLEYQESELTGMKGTSTRFIVNQDEVELTRTGMIESRMLFQRGKRNSSLYETPWGTMMVDVATTQLAHRLSERGGVMEIGFTIAVNHQVTGENRFKIRVKAAVR